MKLKFAAFALLSCALICLSTAAFAYPTSNQFYMGAQAGYGGMLTYQPSSFPTTTGSALNTTYTGDQLRQGVTYRGDLGYLWTFDHNQYGLELGYMGYPKNNYDLGDVNGANGKKTLVYKGSTIDALIVLKHNYDNNINIAAKFGAAQVTQKLENAQATDIQIGNQTIFMRRSAVLPEVALALGYDLTPNVGIDLGANYVFGGSSGQNLATASTAQDADKVASVAAGFAGVYVQF
ncbi:MAG: hypothetical protein K5Q00_00240 [Gammaproteobacteria bacterium]|nr:hypothetical protein [Gammaproteobacteria bacterium]